MITMNWQDTTFKASDVIKIVGVVCIGAAAWATLKSDVGSINTSVEDVVQTVNDVRGTQLENTKKNDLRWETISIELNQLKLNQSLMEQRIKALENRK